MKKAPEIIARLIEDKSFRAWVLKSNASAQAYWEEWIAQHPEHREDVEIASEIVRGIKFSSKKLSHSEVSTAWQDLQHKIAHQKIYLNLRLWAASLAGLAIITVTIWFLITTPSKETVYKTPFGKTGFWELPDGSKVTLNAHSQVTYQMREKPYPLREVSITGEAYFEVAHLEMGTTVPFIVKTPDLTIKVLGTEFNVSTRRGRTSVVLDAGKVQVQLPAEDTTTTMIPGERVEYVPSENEILRENVDTKIFTSWRNHLMKFDDTTLEKVASLIEDNYGVTVKFEDPGLRMIRVTGEISDKNLETLLLALSKLFDLDIKHIRNTVHIKKRYKP